MTPVLLRDLKKGDFFKLKNSETATVFVRDDYDRSSKKYSYYAFDDICRFGMRKGTTIVYKDFIF